MLKLSTMGTVVDEDEFDDEEEDVGWTDSVDSSNNKITLLVEWKVCVASFLGS